MENYLQKVDSDYGFSVAKKLISFRNTEKGFRLAGTRAENEAADWIAEEMKSIGLQEVTKESLRADSWDFREATVTVLSPNKCLDALHHRCHAELSLYRAPVSPSSGAVSFIIFSIPVL